MENCNNTVIELTVNVKRFDKTKGELIDSISTGAKYTKSNAGKLLENPVIRSIEESVNLNLEYCSEGVDGEVGCPRIVASTQTKLNKAE